MAGDWVVWCVGFSRKREVAAIAASAGRDRRLVACLLMEFFEWADGETADGFLPGLTVRILSALHADAGEPIFRAMVSVGWLRETDDGVLLVNFERWNGRSAKRRLQETRRKQEDRAKSKSEGRKAVRNLSASDADKNGTTEQNSREYKTVAAQQAAATAAGEPEPPKKPPPKNPKAAAFDPPPALDTAEAKSAWVRWLAYLAEKGKRYPSTVAKHGEIVAAMGAARACAAIDHSITRGWNEPIEPRADDARAPPGRGTFEEQLARVKGRIDAEANGRDGP